MSQINKPTVRLPHWQVMFGQRGAAQPHAQGATTTPQPAQPQTAPDHGAVSHAAQRFRVPSGPLPPPIPHLLHPNLKSVPEEFDRFAQAMHARFPAEIKLRSFQHLGSDSVAEHLRDAVLDFAAQDFPDAHPTVVRTLAEEYLYIAVPYEVLLETHADTMMLESALAQADDPAERAAIEGQLTQAHGRYTTLHEKILAIRDQLIALEESTAQARGAIDLIMSKREFLPPAFGDAVETIESHLAAVEAAHLAIKGDVAAVSAADAAPLLTEPAAIPNVAQAATRQMQAQTSFSLEHIYQPEVAQAISVKFANVSEPYAVAVRTLIHHSESVRQEIVEAILAATWERRGDTFDSLLALINGAAPTVATYLRRGDELRAMFSGEPQEDALVSAVLSRLDAYFLSKIDPRGIQKLIEVRWPREAREEVAAGRVAPAVETEVGGDGAGHEGDAQDQPAEAPLREGEIEVPSGSAIAPVPPIGGRAVPTPPTASTPTPPPTDSPAAGSYSLPLDFSLAPKDLRNGVDRKLGTGTFDAVVKTMRGMFSTVPRPLIMLYAAQIARQANIISDSALEKALEKKLGVYIVPKTIRENLERLAAEAYPVGSFAYEAALTFLLGRLTTFVYETRENPNSQRAAFAKVPGWLREFVLPAEPADPIHGAVIHSLERHFGPGAFMESLATLQDRWEEMRQGYPERQEIPDAYLPIVMAKAAALPSTASIADVVSVTSKYLRRLADNQIAHVNAEVERLVPEDDRARIQQRILNDFLLRYLQEGGKSATIRHHVELWIIEAMGEPTEAATDASESVDALAPAPASAPVPEPAPAPEPVPDPTPTPVSTPDLTSAASPITIQPADVVVSRPTQARTTHPIRQLLAVTFGFAEDSEYGPDAKDRRIMGAMWERLRRMPEGIWNTMFGICSTVRDAVDSHYGKPLEALTHEEALDRHWRLRAILRAIRDKVHERGRTPTRAFVRGAIESSLSTRRLTGDAAREYMAQVNGNGDSEPVATITPIRDLESQRDMITARLDFEPDAPIDAFIRRVLSSNNLRFADVLWEDIGTVYDGFRLSLPAGYRAGALNALFEDCATGYTDPSQLGPRLKTYLEAWGQSTHTFILRTLGIILNGTDEYPPYISRENIHRWHDDLVTEVKEDTRAWASFADLATIKKRIEDGVTERASAWRPTTRAEAIAVMRSDLIDGANSVDAHHYVNELHGLAEAARDQVLVAAVASVMDDEDVDWGILRAAFDRRVGLAQSLLQNPASPPVANTEPDPTPFDVTPDVTAEVATDEFVDDDFAFDIDTATVAARGAAEAMPTIDATPREIQVALDRLNVAIERRQPVRRPQFRAIATFEQGHHFPQELYLISALRYFGDVLSSHQDESVEGAHEITEAIDAFLTRHCHATLALMTGESVDWTRNRRWKSHVFNLTRHGGELQALMVRIVRAVDNVS